MNLSFKRTKTLYLYRYDFIGCLLILPALLLFANPRDQLGDVNTNAINNMDLICIQEYFLFETVTHVKSFRKLYYFPCDEHIPLNLINL